MAGKSSVPGLLHLVEAVDAGGGLLRDAAQLRRDLRPQARAALREVAQQVEHDAPLLGVLLRVEVGDAARLLELEALVHEQRRVAAVVDDQVGPAPVGPDQRVGGAPPVLLERLALPGEDGRAARVLGRALAADRDGGGRGVLGREDVARHPAHVGAEIDERLDQHRGLHGHVQAAHDADAVERLLRAVALAQRHQPRHLVLGEADLLAAELGEGEVLDLERGDRAGHGPPRKEVTKKD